MIALHHFESSLLNMLHIILVLFVLFVTTVLLFYKWRFNYWRKKNVPYIEPSIPWGTITNPFSPSVSIFELLKGNYDELKSKGHKHGGIYLLAKPAYLPVDLDLIKRILSKDFQYFVGHGMDVDEKNDPLSGNLFNLEGEKWRNLRMKLTPTFTSGKMKMMFQTLVDCGGPMIKHINQLCDEGKSLDIKEILACFTTDVIGSCGFGLECNSFKDPNSDFRKYGKQIFTPDLKMRTKEFASHFAPRVIKKMLNLTGNELSSFFINVTKNIVEYRETHDYKRNDFIQLLLELKQKSNGTDDGLTVEQMAAQSFLFFLAGYESSSTTMTFCLHELSYNRDIQEKLREEVNATMQKYEGKLTYECVMEMKYMNKVIEETLRKYPAGAAIGRSCTKDYKIEETGTIIEAKTPVIISVLGLHRDPEYYPDPEQFDPERFSEENKSTRPQFSYIPFGEGPRICIGLRFALMQMKVGLSLLLKNYIFLPHETSKYDMEFHINAIVLSFRGTLLVNARRIN